MSRHTGAASYYRHSGGFTAISRRRADVVIIRLGRLGVWDVAGWSIIVEAAGGVVCNGKGVRPQFGARLPAEDFVIFALPSLKEEAVCIASTLTEDPSSEKRG